MTIITAVVVCYVCQCWVEARKAYTDDVEVYKEYLADVIESLNSKQAVHDAAAKAITRALMTKCETYCLRTIRDSRSKRQLLIKYTSQFTSKADMDWKSPDAGMSPELLEKINSILEAEPPAGVDGAQAVSRSR